MGGSEESAGLEAVAHSPPLFAVVLGSLFHLSPLTRCSLPWSRLQKDARPRILRTRGQW